jgi:hypothetical protein
MGRGIVVQRLTDRDPEHEEQHGGRERAEQETPVAAHAW